MSWSKGELTCDGCRVPREKTEVIHDWVTFSPTSGPGRTWQHYHRGCWLTGWYTDIEPKGEWPISEEPEPAFDHVQNSLRLMDKPLDPKAFEGEVRTVSRTGGEKGVKPARFDLVPVGPLTTVAKLYGKGASKYDDHNWMRGYEWSKSYAALMRHVTQFWGGEDLDPDTELPHLASVVFHAFALMHYMDEHRSFDDRPRVANDDSVK